MGPLGALIGGGFGPLFRIYAVDSKKGNGHGYLGVVGVAGGRMDHLRALIGVVLLLSCRLACADAYADWTTVDSNAVFHGGSAQAACSAAAAASRGNQDGHVVTASASALGPSEAYCMYYKDGVFAFDGYAQKSCPGGGSSCVDAPAPHPCGAAGTVIKHPPTEVMQMPDGQAPGAVCDNGCTAMPAHTVTNDMGNSYSYGDTIGTGHACGANFSGGGRGPADPPAPDAPAGSDNTGGDPGHPAPTDAAQCVGAGRCPGTVNGTTVCVACGSTSGSGVSSSSNSGPGGTAGVGETTTTTSTENPDGTSTTTTVTHRTDGSTSQTVTTGPGGFGVPPGLGGSSGGGGAGPGGGNCTGTDCGTADAFGGVCGGTFTCSGDAIQCAIAKDQHIRACQMYEPETAGGEWASGAQKLATAKTDGDQPSWSPAHSSQWQSKTMTWDGTIDQSDPLAAQCPGDVNVGALGGQELVIPFSRLCPYLQMMGQALLAFTAIACAMILFKREH